VGGVALFTLGGSVAAWAVENLGLDPRVLFWWDLIRGPGVIAGLAIALSAIYGLLPNVPLRLRHTWPGAAFATVAWLLLTVGFGFHVSKLGSYDQTFGSLGTAVVLMVWMYAVAMILLIGGEINALTVGHTPPAEPPDPALEDAA
jgi:membrane protein